MTSVLELKNVTKNFGPLRILEDINLSLKKGKVIAILGPSGAGKSTLLHIAGLMEKPSGGEIHLNNKPAHQLSEVERSHERLNTLGFLFQFHHLLPEFDVLENALIPCRLANDNMKSSTKYARVVLNRLGLGERLHHRPHQLSGGEQQRVALARALVRKPQILLCDEPTGNLDQNTAQEVWRLIFDEVKNEGLATIIVTHNEGLASQASLSYYLTGGVLQQQN